MPVIDHIDPLTRRVYLSAETISLDFHPMDAYTEMRNLRKTDESLRPFDIFMLGKGKDKICSRFQNSEFYFRKGMTWSLGGFYSPTFRFSGLGVFDVMGSRTIIKNEKNLIQISAVISSKLAKFFMKNYLDHTIILQIDEFA